MSKTFVRKVHVLISIAVELTFLFFAISKRSGCWNLEAERNLAEIWKVEFLRKL